MGKFYDMLRHNKIYAVLLFVLLAINVSVFSELMGANQDRAPADAVEIASVRQEGEGPSEKKKIFDPDEIKEREMRIEAMARENPVLYFFLVAVNLSIFFAMLVGIIIDAVLLSRRRKGKRIDIVLAHTEKPAWDVSDVFRVVIIFVFAGYVFVFIQMFLSGIFPILRNVNLRMISDTAFMGISGIAVVFYFVFRKYSQGRAAIGLAGVNGGKVISTAIAGYMAIIPVLLGVMAATFFFIKYINYEPPLQPIVEVLSKEKDTGILWVSILFAAIFGPVAEEIFFRGFMYPAVKKKWGVLPAILGTAVIFSMLHTHIVGFLPIMILGVLLAYLYEKTGSLFVPMAVHMIHNVGMVVMVFLMRAVGT